MNGLTPAFSFPPASIASAARFCEVTECAGTTEAAVLSGAHSPYFGISMGSRFFRVPENLAAYFCWGASVSKAPRVPVVMADSIGAINIRALQTPKDVQKAGGHSEADARAYEEAKTAARKMRDRILDVLKSLPDDVANRIWLLGWQELANYSRRKYDINLRLLTRAYEKQDGDCSIRIQAMVTDMLQKHGRSASDEQIRKLGMYIVHEIALIIGGVDIIRGGRGRRVREHYDLTPYPYVPEMQSLIADLQAGRGGQGFARLRRNLIFSGELCAVGLKPTPAPAV